MASQDTPTALEQWEQLTDHTFREKSRCDCAKAVRLLLSSCIAKSILYRCNMPKRDVLAWKHALGLDGSTEDSTLAESSRDL